MRRGTRPASTRNRSADAPVIGPGTRRWRLVRATATAIPPSVRRFNARARARRWRRARPFVIVATVLVVLGAVAYVGLATSVLGVRTVEIRDAGFVGATDVRAAAAIRTGTPLLGLDTRAVAHRVQRLVGVAHADVSRRLPSTVVIDVTVRTAVAAIPGPGKAYRLVDASGVVFRTVSDRPSDLMIVRLSTPGPTDPSTQGALAVLASLPSSLRDEVDYITAPTPAEIQLALRGGRKIVWGDATDNAAKARVSLSLLAHPGTVIDVSAPNVVTVR